MAGPRLDAAASEISNPHLGGPEQSAIWGASLPDRFIETTLARIDGAPAIGQLTLAPALEAVNPPADEQPDTPPVPLAA